MRIASLEEGFISTMSDSLTEDYLRWLAPQIREDQSGLSRSYETLLVLLYEKEFVWLVPNDDNRVADGLNLRVEFCYAQNISTSVSAQLGPCSFLEVLIGLSRRLAFNAGGSAPGWAWQLLRNLRLDRMADPLSTHRTRRIDSILDRCVWRQYQPDGIGGFFPLAWPNEDQTKVELWYQMAAYIDEIHPEY